jgi:hypothetical protein
MGDIAPDQAEEILTNDVSDEMLESAGGHGKRGTPHTLFLHRFRSLPRPMNALDALSLTISVNFKSGSVVCTAEEISWHRSDARS